MVKRGLVLGSANCLQKDIDAVLKMANFEVVVAAKGAGLVWPFELNGWVSLHPDRMQKDRDERDRNGYPVADVHFGHQRKENCEGIDVWYDYKFEGQLRSGSSGLFAVKVALEYFHCDQVVMCGIPLLRDEGRIDGKETWNGASSFHKGFEEAMPAFKDRVRSMGGWTALRVGLPTTTWLKI